MADERGSILLIDDEPVIIDFLRAILEADYALFYATDPFDGLALARAKQPDLILLDIAMPEADGYHLCRTLKSDLLTQAIPIIFITALTSPDDETRGLEAGAVDYIAKPINTSVVKARVGNHMELKKQRDFLETLASVDALTGIPNRRGFDDYLDREWRRAARTGTPLSLLMIDIDYFKSYNDEQGHLAGDDCLKAVAQQLKNVPHRGGDLVARFGGEEFRAVLSDTPFESLRFMAEKFRSSVEAAKIPHASSPVSEVVTVSVGAATVVPVHQCSPLVLIEKADRMLYRAKCQGRNRVVAEVLSVDPCDMRDAMSASAHPDI
jgi:diguanylate cyclase (GGDEF)-like protein